MMTTEEMLAEILAKLEEVDALLGICAGPPTPSSPPSIPTHIAGSGEDQERGVRASVGFPNSTPSTASAMDADPGFQSSVTELPDPPVSIDGHLGILFDADGRGVDCLSRLSDSLLRDIASRLPIKEAARTAVLSRRWSLIWRAASLLTLSNSPVSTLVLANKDISLAIPIASSDDRERVLSITTSNLATAASASPTPSATPAPSEDTALDAQIGVTKLLVMAHTRCSTPSPYQGTDILLSAAPPLAPAMGLNADVMKLATASSTPLRASSTSVLPLSYILDFPHTSTELGMVVLTMGSMRGCGCDTGVPLPANALDSNPSRDIVICLFDISKGAGKILATTTENVSVSEFMMLRSPWPPPAQAEVPGNGMLLRPAPWPLFNQGYAKIQTAAVIGLWMMWCFHNKREAFKLKPLWPPPAWMCSFGAKVTEGIVRQIAHGLILELSTFFLDVSLTFDLSEMTRLQLNGEHFRIPLWYTISIHLHTGSTNDNQGSQMPKPPWLLCFGERQVIGVFLLEVPQWCREYVALVQWKTSRLPPVQLKMAPRGTNLPQLAGPLFFCSEAEQRSKLLLLHMFLICNPQVLLIHSNLQPCVLVLNDLSKGKLLEHLMVVYLKIGVEQFVDADRNYYYYLGSVKNELQIHTCGELVTITGHTQIAVMQGDTAAHGLDMRLLCIYHKRKGATDSSIQEHTGYMFIVIHMSCMMRKFGALDSLHSAHGRQQLTLWPSTVKAVYIEIEKRAVSVGAVVCQMKLPTVLIKRDGWLLELSTWKVADQILHMLSSATAWGQAVFQGGGNECHGTGCRHPILAQELGGPESPKRYGGPEWNTWPSPVASGEWLFLLQL